MEAVVFFTLWALYFSCIEVKMLLLFLTLLSISFASATARCDACLYNNCFQKIIVLERYEQIGQLAIDRIDNIFYYHIKNSKERSFSIAYDLDHVKMDKIDGIHFSFARAVDDKTRDLYLSLENSVYKVNPRTNFTNGETIFEKTVWHMQFKDKLYYTEFGLKGLQIFENNQHVSIAGLLNYQIDDFVVDKNNDIYFLADFTIYRLKHGENRAKKFADDIYVLSTDKNGDVYFAQPFQKAFYKLDDTEDKMTEIGAIEVGTPFKFVFTSDNYIIYSDVQLNGMYMLVPSAGVCKIGQSGEGASLQKTVSLDV